MYLDCQLFVIVIKAIQPDCDKVKGISVLLLETPLTRSKYISPYTHAQHLTRTSRTFYTFAYKQTLQVARRGARKVARKVLIRVLIRIPHRGAHKVARKSACKVACRGAHKVACRGAHRGAHKVALNGLNRIDFSRSRKVNAVDPFG